MTPAELAQIRARDGRLPADLPSHWQLQIDRRRLLAHIDEHAPLSSFASLVPEHGLAAGSVDAVLRYVHEQAIHHNAETAVADLPGSAEAERQVSELRAAAVVLAAELERSRTQIAELAAWASAGAAANEGHPLAASMHQRLAAGEFGPITGGLGPCEVEDADGGGSCGAAAVQIHDGVRLCYWHRIPR